MIDTPDFATKLGIWTVSNQRSKDRAKDFFEKIHVRPQIEKAKKVLRNKQSTSKEILEAKDVLYRLRDGRGSANMAGGTATQVATDLNLVMDKQGKPFHWLRQSMPASNICKHISQTATMMKLAKKNI